MFQGVIENILIGVLTMLIANFRGKLHEILAKCGAKLNGKIEGTDTQLDDIAKGELVAALKEAFIPALEVDGPVRPTA